MAERKYRQQGYRGQDVEPRRGGQPASGNPRIRSMLAQRTVSRCGAALHACRQCAHFDTSARFECAQVIPARQVDKAARNDCAMFSLRVMVERDSSPDSTRPGDIRRAFDDLFKQ